MARPSTPIGSSALVVFDLTPVRPVAAAFRTRRSTFRAFARNDRTVDLTSAQLDLIRGLMNLDPPVFLFGGYAEDALLHGTVARPHDDVDVFVWFDELQVRMQQVRALGFDAIESRFEPSPGRPLVVGAARGDLQLELCVGARSDGRAYFELPGNGGLDRVWLPDDFVNYPAQRLDDLVVNTISPLALYQVRMALAAVFGGFRPKDELSQAALRDRFFAETSDADLAPAITRARA